MRVFLPEYHISRPPLFDSGIHAPELHRMPQHGAEIHCVIRITT
jgi:hypothetical protein